MNSLENATFALVQRFRAIEKTQRDIDFKRSEWCSEVRALAGNDDAFARWCQTKLLLTQNEISQLLQRARAATLVTDSRSWEQLRGFKGIRAVLHLPKTEQINVVQAAKVAGRPIRSVMIERGHLRTYEPIDKTPPGKTKTMGDVEMLAKYIAAQLPNAKLPRDVETLVLMYVPSFGKRKAS